MNKLYLVIIFFIHLGKSWLVGWFIWDKVHKGHTAPDIGEKERYLMSSIQYAFNEHNEKVST